MYTLTVHAKWIGQCTSDIRTSNLLDLSNFCRFFTITTITNLHSGLENGKNKIIRLFLSSTMIKCKVTHEPRTLLIFREYWTKKTKIYAHRKQDIIGWVCKYKSYISYLQFYGWNITYRYSNKQANGNHCFEQKYTKYRYSRPQFVSLSIAQLHGWTGVVDWFTFQ